MCTERKARRETSFFVRKCNFAIIHKVKISEKILYDLTNDDTSESSQMYWGIEGKRNFLFVRMAE